MGKSRQKILKKYFPKNAVGAEVGVHLGEFSQEIIDVTTPNRLYLIDPWAVIEDNTYVRSWYGSKTPKQEMDERYKGVCSRFKRYSGVEIHRRFSYNVDDIIQDNSLDFVYIDGDHTYDGVMKDFDIYYRKLKVGGLIAGDDYKTGQWWGEGVIDAVHYNLHHKNLRVSYFSKDQFGLIKF